MKSVLALSMLAAASAQKADTFARFSADLSANVNPEALQIMEVMDVNREIEKAERERGETKVLIFGKQNKVNQDLFAVAAKSKAATGTVYTAAYNVPNAKSIAVHFDQFDVPEGGALYVVGENRILGPFTHETKWRLGNLMTQHLDGDQVTIQYYQDDSAAKLPATIHVDVVTGAFQHLDDIARNAGVCNIQGICAAETSDRSETDNSQVENRCSGCSPTDRSCSIQCVNRNGNPSEARWADPTWASLEQHGVVAMASQAGSRFCSGSFINNADGKPLVLTAAHCGVTGGTTMVHTMFRSNACSSADNRSGDHVAIGDLTLVASRSDSDMTLLEVGGRFDDDVYLAGWEAELAADGEGIPHPAALGLHHPSSSNMKISYSAMETVKGRWSGSGEPTHWETPYWTEATTEPGSSGSPLYNPFTRRIIGQLHGGAAACPANNGYDTYGSVWSSFKHNAAFRDALAGSTGAVNMDGRWYSDAKKGRN